MPNRVLRDGINSSHAVNSLSEQAEIFYRRLMSLVDDYGRFEADADLIRAGCFALQLDRWPVARIDECLRELMHSPLLVVYAVNGKQYLQINNFGQRIQSKPKHPGPESADSEALRRTTVNHGESRWSTVYARATTPTPSREVLEKGECEGETTMRAEFDDQWAELQRAVAECGRSWSKPDWQKAHAGQWRFLDFEQRQVAIDGYRARAGTQDWCLTVAPLVYLRDRLWERTVEKPARRMTQMEEVWARVK